jgi:coatomer subunit beta
VYFETVDKTDSNSGKLREEMILVCNFLRKDLMHANEFVRGCALRFVAKLKEFELLEPLIKPIKENLDHRHSYVRRNAVLALHNAYRVSDTLCVDAPEIMERQIKVCHCRAKACIYVTFTPQVETDNSARRNALNMLIACAPTRAVAFVLANIAQLNSLGDIIQIVALELIRKVCKQNPQEKGSYMGAIFEMLSSTSPSVVFQCATTIIQAP